MRAVWSFWSKPFQRGHSNSWRSPLHHMLAWGLSLRLARKHFPETMLVTDTPGKAFLVDSLGLHFTHVSTELDNYRHCNPQWWALSKLVAYRAQERPFVHLDTDVFLWKPLPAAVQSAPVFAQSPEEHAPLERGNPGEIERAFDAQGIALPVEWDWMRSRMTHSFHEANCGILGANRTDFIQYYASLALDLMTSPEYASVWAGFSDLRNFMMITEQFLLDACFEYHRFHPESPFRGIHMRYLFGSFSEAYNHEASARIGFTHLLGGAKQDPYVSRRLEERTQQEDQSFYRHCVQLNRHGVTGLSA